MVDLGIINIDSMSVSWWMFIPAVLGAAIALFIVKFINQKLFESLVWIFIVIADLRAFLEENMAKVRESYGQNI